MKFFSIAFHSLDYGSFNFFFLILKRWVSVVISCPVLSLFFDHLIMSLLHIPGLKTGMTHAEMIWTATTSLTRLKVSELSDLFYSHGNLFCIIKTSEEILFYIVMEFSLVNNWFSLNGMIFTMLRERGFHLGFLFSSRPRFLSDSLFICFHFLCYRSYCNWYFSFNSLTLVTFLPFHSVCQTLDNIYGWQQCPVLKTVCCLLVFEISLTKQYQRYSIFSFFFSMLLYLLGYHK